MLSTAVAVAFIFLVWLSPGARGETSTPKVDVNQQGEPYAAGELIVTYESNVSGQHVDKVVHEAKAREGEEIPIPDVQLLSFPGVKHEHSEKVREVKLRHAKETLEQDP